ncbi:MAG TPA: hypothetical protein VF013_06880 [Candidatus Limnocylindria bacterium]
MTHAAWRVVPLALLAVALIGCSSVPSPIPSTTALPTPSITCGDLDAADCGAASEAALAAIPDYRVSGTTAQPVITVELGSGVFCPVVDLLLKQTMCPPASIPPSTGGQWIGHALVTFSGTAAQAYLNISKDGTVVGASFIAIATPVPSPS